MELLDPATGRPLPEDAIQRILFLANAVHVYNIPPLASTKGHVAASWTTDPSRHIFTARLRLVETSFEAPSSSTPSNATPTEQLKVDLILEDSSSGQLFAAAPYTARNVVEPAVDSSRFFAITVRDPSGRKAVLGMGFEERSEAFDLGVALQEASRALGWDADQNAKNRGAAAGSKTKEEEKARDYSLKDGETITVNLASSKAGRRRSQLQQPDGQTSGPLDLQSFALAPPRGPAGGGSPLGSGGGFSLPPPPSSKEVKKQRRQSAKDLGFDDGQFGEFE